MNKNVINVYGETGSGKTSFIKELNLNNMNSLVIDFKGYDSYKEFKHVISNKEKLNKNTCLKLIKKIEDKYKFIIIDDLDKNIFSLIEIDLNQFIIKNPETIFILISNFQIFFHTLNINHLEIKEASLIETGLIFKNNIKLGEI